jgi:hypothetical protein
MLYAAGLSRRHANRLAYVILPLHKTCYTQIQLLEIAVEYALGMYDKVLKPGQTYFVDTPVMDTWIPNTTFKYACNVSESTHLYIRAFEVVLQSFPDLHGSAKLYFHATNIRGALSIVRQGISHTDGRKCLDFGINPSFYLTPDIRTAVKWCIKKKRVWQGEMCILVFKIPHVFLEAMKGKVFESATAEWEELVTSSRRCIVKINDLDLFDTVYGPMASNIHSIDKDNKFARPHKTPKFQLASKSVASDAYYNKCFSGALFMRVPS